MKKRSFTKSSRIQTSERYNLKDFETKTLKMKETEFGRAIHGFCKDTTLHGFKYLTSKSYYDRVGWFICCCASACCAGVLCSVLWARFLQVPALLTQRDLREQLATVHMPAVAVCLSPESVAYYFDKNLSINTETRLQLPIILGHITLRRNKMSTEQLTLLEDVLMKNNLSLKQALVRLTPPCDDIVTNCRWQMDMMSCAELFRKQLTERRVCCISKPHNLKMTYTEASRLHVTRRLSFAVQCSGQSDLGSCEFFTKYHGEEWVQPMPLSPGYNHLAHVTFTSLIHGDPDKLADGTCDTSDDYSRNECLLMCKEKHCGCLEPLRNKYTKGLPPCLITELDCLRTFQFENTSCNCLPSCKKVFTFMALESSPLNALKYTHDDVYAGLNASTSSVLHIIVRISESRLFVINSTETWITLLSSLGGVFNMFLGVGLFSALEVLFLAFVRLPIAIRRSTAMAESSDM